MIPLEVINVHLAYCLSECEDVNNALNHQRINAPIGRKSNNKTEHLFSLLDHFKKIHKPYDIFLFFPICHSFSGSSSSDDSFHLVVTFSLRSLFNGNWYSGKNNKFDMCEWCSTKKQCAGKSSSVDECSLRIKMSHRFQSIFTPE